MGFRVDPQIVGLLMLHSRSCCSTSPTRAMSGALAFWLATYLACPHCIRVGKRLQLTPAAERLSPISDWIIKGGAMATDPVGPDNRRRRRWDPRPSKWGQPARGADPRRETRLVPNAADTTRRLMRPPGPRQT